MGNLFACCCRKPEIPNIDVNSEVDSNCCHHINDSCPSSCCIIVIRRNNSVSRK